MKLFHLGKDLLAKFLLKHGAYANTVHYDGRSALHEAARWGNLDLFDDIG